MHAVIKTGGKQYRVEPGQQLQVERVPEGELSFRPVLVVDGEDVRSTPSQLAGAEVRARHVGEARGPKIVGFTYIAKARRRRRWGHREPY